MGLYLLTVQTGDHRLSLFLDFEMSFHITYLLDFHDLPEILFSLDFGDF